MSPTPTTLPSAPFATMPEMKISRPLASTSIACAKWPEGVGSFALRISFFAI